MTKPAEVAAPSIPTDRFGNPIDPVVGFARGRILGSSIDEARRLRHGQAVAAARVRHLGAESIGVFTGNQRDFPIKPDDLRTLCEEWVGPGLLAEDLRQVAIAHFKGRPDDGVAIFNRTSAGIVATIAALADGKPVVSLVPASGRSHASVVRGCRLAGVDLVEVTAEQDWNKAVSHTKPALLLITTVTSSLERLDDETLVAAASLGKRNDAIVFLDEAYGARLRTVLHDGVYPLTTEADLAITNCDKAGLSGPRAGVLVGRAALVTAAGAKGAEYGMEARAPIAAGALRSLQGFTPEHLRLEAEAGRKLSIDLEARLGSVFVKSSDLGPMIHEDDVLAIALQRSGSPGSNVVPAEAAAALGMLLLRDHGILTVNTHGQPGARVSLRLKPTLDALARVGGNNAVVSAVDEALTNLGTLLLDESAMATLIVGSQS